MTKPLKTSPTTVVCVLFGAVLICGLLAVVLVCGCSGSGYTVGDQYRPGIRTVAVDVWQRGREIYRRDIEMRLTEAVVKRIEQDTPYKVTTKARADTLLTGSIDKIEQRTLAFSPDTGLPRETEITMTVSFVWKDLRSGETIVEEEELIVSGRYTREAPIESDFFQGSEGLINRVARQVVEHMEKPW